MLLLVVFVWGLLVCLHYGRIGYHPVDHSIVFDGAWRLLSGQLPFRDYHTPSGVTPIVMQAAFFKLLGVTWFSYCLHAAVMNGAFCALVCLLLRALRGSRFVAALAALGSGLVFYPPQGVPYMDQHAFFFTLLAVVLAVWAGRATGTGETVLWALVPPALALAYLSKQIPTAFGLPMIVLLWATGRDRTRAALVLCASALATVASLATLALALWVPLRRFHYDYYVLPISVGESRAAADVGTVGLLRSLFGLCRILDLWSLDLLAVASLPWVVLVGIEIARRATGRAPLRPTGWPEGLLASGFAAICLLFAHLTNNDAPECVPLVFAALGLGWAGLVRSAPRSGAVRYLGAALLIVGLRDAVTFHLAVNVPRSTLAERLTREEGSELLPPALSFLRFRVPQEYKNASAKSLADIVRFFEEHPGNFMLVGDDTILYALTGRPSVGSSLWFHPGLTIPSHKSPEYGAYLEELSARLERYRVRYVVLEGKQTWMEVSLSQLPPVRALVQTRGGPTVKIGPFAIVEIRPPAGEGS